MIGRLLYDSQGEIACALEVLRSLGRGHAWKDGWMSCRVGRRALHRLVGAENDVACVLSCHASALSTNTGVWECVQHSC